MVKGGFMIKKILLKLSNIKSVYISNCPVCGEFIGADVTYCPHCNECI